MFTSVGLSYLHTTNKPPRGSRVFRMFRHAAIPHPTFSASWCIIWKFCIHVYQSWSGPWGLASGQYTDSLLLREGGSLKIDHLWSYSSAYPIKVIAAASLSTSFPFITVNPPFIPPPFQNWFELWSSVKWHIVNSCHIVRSISSCLLIQILAFISFSLSFISQLGIPGLQRWNGAV